jgi:predicted RND superfamily exporter protein
VPDVLSGAPMDHKPGFYGRLAARVMDHPRATIAIVLTLLALSGVSSALWLRINPDLLQLLPKENSVVKAIKDLEKEEGGVNLLTISVEGEDPAQVDAFAKLLTARLAALPEVDYALYDIDPDLAWNIGLHELPPEDLGIIRDRLRAAIALGPAAANPFLASRLLDLGPLTEKLKSPGQSAALASSKGVSRILVRPKGSGTDVAFAKTFMADVYKVLGEVDPKRYGARVAWIGGPYRHNVEDFESINHDLTWTTWVSVVLTFLIIAIAYRDPRAILLILIPPLIGNGLAFGYAVLVVGTLTTFTSFFTAILVGLGVEFSVHLYSRYREERLKTDDLREAVIRTWDVLGPPSFTAALTAAGAFCSLWAAGFEGFRQMGTLLAGGNLLCFASVIVTLPLFIMWREKRPHAVPLRDIKLKIRERPPTYRLAPLALLILVMFTGLMAFQIPNIPFQYDMSELRTRGLAFNDLDEEQRELAQESYSPIVVSYDDADTLYADFQKISADMASGALPEIGRAISVFSVLPRDQDKQVAALREIADLSRDPNVQYLPPQVQENLRKIASADLRPLVADDLPYALRHVIGAAGTTHRMLLIPTGNMWDLRQMVKLHRVLERELPDRKYAGGYLAQSILFRVIKRDGPRVALTALVFVFIVTLIDLRSLRTALGAVGALLAGMIWAGGVMAIFQIKLSMLNFVAIPMLLGIAIDVVIHLLHRLHEEGPGRVLYTLATTGWASAVATSTSIASFGALLVASNQGIRSLGVLVVTGLIVVTTAAFVLVPLGWMTTWKIQGQLPSRELEQTD